MNELILSKATAFSKEFKTVDGSDAVFQLLQYAAMYMASARAGHPAAEKWGKLASTLSTVRTVGRWTGMLDTGLWIASERAAPSQADAVSQALQLGRAAAIWAYYPLEHAWFLDSMGLLRLRDPGWYSRASCAMWALYIVLTLLQILHAAYRQRSAPSSGAALSLAKNALDFPLSLHWSMQGGCLSDPTTAILGILGSCIQVYQRWSNL